MINNKNDDLIILSGIAGFTIIVVALIWFLSSANTQVNNAAAVKTPKSDDMASHHSGGRSRASTATIDALVGKPVPDFALMDKDGRAYSKDNLKGKNVILFFNEGLMCYPACWNQIVELAKDSRLNGEDVVVLSVVTDPAKDWQRAISKMPELAEATVVFDTGGTVSNKFGALTAASSMHFGQLPGHTYVLIDKEGIVKHVYDDPGMAIHNNQLAEELAKLKQL